MEKSRKIHIIAILVFAIIGVLAWHFLGRPDVADLQEIFPDWSFENLWNEGSYLTDNSTHYWSGAGKTGGLDLVLRNLLDDSWQGEFQVAVADWESGTPDTLTLFPEKGVAGEQCDFELGLMKVCNANYGKTDWLGINEMMLTGLNGETIVASVAKMNDHFMARASVDERRYLMCHEIGHGFGLPHTDENFRNKDLGNCLDYTNRPQNNLHPGQVNFERLAEMYGTIGSTASPRPRPTLPPKPEKEDKKEKQGDNDDRRLLRGANNAPSVEDNVESFPRELLQKYQIAMTELEEILSIDSAIGGEGDHGWRRLQEHSHGAEFVRRLDGKYTLKVHMLYAPQ